MRKHKFVNNPEVLLKQGQKIVSASNESKYIYRVTLVNLILAGKMTSAELSTLSGVADRTLRTWVKIADEQGFEQLRAVKQEGRPTRLNAVQTAELKDVLTKSPSNYGYKVWDGPSLSSYIKKTYQIELKVGQCQRLFHKLGFSLIRPQTYPSLGEQNKEEREDFKKTKRHFT